jgi:hypothetical protein
MEYWQEKIWQRLERFHSEGGDQGLAISIKVRVRYGCFCYGHSPHLERMFHRHWDREKPNRAEYVEHESGPEWLIYLTLAVGGLTIAEKSLGIIKSIIDLLAIAAKTHAEERRKRNEQPEPLVIVVRGFTPERVFFEKTVIEIDWGNPPADEAIKESLTEVIQQIAEERVRQAQGK